MTEAETLLKECLEDISYLKLSIEQDGKCLPEKVVEEILVCVASAEFHVKNINLRLAMQEIQNAIDYIVEHGDDGTLGSPTCL